MGQPLRTRPDPVSVWIVEDGDDYRRTLAERIEAEEDLTCPHTFASAEELLGFLDDHFMPEVLLMDIGLPGMDGIEAVRRVKPVALGTAIVMVTVHEDSDRIFQALCAGASGYLAKSASGDEVVAAIRDVLRGGAAMSPRIARRVLDMFAQLQAPRHDYGLTRREKDVLEELVRGHTKKAMARNLHLSAHTVDTHLRSIYAKLHVTTQTAAVAKAVGERLVR